MVMVIKVKKAKQFPIMLHLEKFLKHKLNLIDSISEEEENFIKQKYEAEVNEKWLNKSQEEI
jgi:hypothetical protein